MSELFALPKRTVLCTLDCAFCEKESAHYAFCGSKLAVMACENPDHIAFAEKSKNVWLGLHKEVIFDDFCKEPLFTQTNILSMDVAVKRSEKLKDGSPKIDREGWKIVKPLISFEPVTVIFYAKKNQWAIGVINHEEQIDKYIALDDLKMSLSEDEHKLVDMFVAKLESGVYYKEDVAAFQMQGSKYSDKSVPELAMAMGKAEI